MGFYITFDGLSGSGKGTIISKTAKLFRESRLTVDVLEDRRIDPLRDCGAKMMPWCNHYGRNKSEFLLALFVAGNILSQKKLEESLLRFDIVLRDRSFITSLAYSPASFDITQSELWDLYVKHAGVRIPDLAVVVDCDVTQAINRVNRRRGHRDIGLGGKMSGDESHQRRIRSEFLKIKDLGMSEFEVLVLENHGDFNDSPKTVQEGVAKLASQIVATHREANYV